MLPAKAGQAFLSFIAVAMGGEKDEVLMINEMQMH